MGRKIRGRGDHSAGFMRRFCLTSNVCCAAAPGNSRPFSTSSRLLPIRTRDTSVIKRRSSSFQALVSMPCIAVPRLDAAKVTLCHVAEVVGARCETRYALLVSALIRIALSVWPALASISPSTPSHRLPLLRCSDVSKNRPPQSVRFSPNNCLLPRHLGLSRYAHCAFPRAVLADRVVSAMTMGRNRATPWLVVFRVSICV